MAVRQDSPELGTSSLRFSLLIALLIAGLWLGQGNAATIELARRADGTSAAGVIIEGEITRGDARKLLEIYKYYGNVAAEKVYLRSLGGDVEEAMELGRLIRRLRLSTEVPIQFEGKEPLTLVHPANHDNFACASACFLAFAGGIERSGNALALHRPYLSKETAANISDAIHETAQKQVIAEVRNYLQQMEVDRFFIEKMLWTNSQDAYPTTVADVLDHHLSGTVPSIEEIVLAKCDIPQWRELERAATRDGKKLEELSGKRRSATECRDQQIEELRRAAWDREHEDLLRAKCPYPPLDTQEAQILQAWLNRNPEPGKEWSGDRYVPRAVPTPEEEPVIDKARQRKDCRAKTLLDLTLAAIKRSHDALQRASLGDRRGQTTDDAADQPFDFNALAAKDTKPSR